MSALDIAIIGYGTAGQAAALALSRDGHRVRVFERAAEPGPVGAGFLLQPTGLAALWQLGLLEAAMAHGRPVHRLYGDTPEGRGVMDMRYDGLDARWFGLGLQRGALFEILRAAWPGANTIAAGRCIVEVDVDAGTLRDEAGAIEGPFDLIIAADGSASRLRGRLPRVALDRPYPWGALWCLLPAGEWPWPDELRQRYRRARRMIGVLPVGTRPGDAVPRVSFFWSLPVAEFATWRARRLNEWRDEVIALWPEIAPLLAPLDRAELLAQASYRDVRLSRDWHRGRLVLIGDAAHAMSPQLGQGVNMALLDVLALRDALRARDTRVHALEWTLRDFARERRRHVAIYQFWSRWLTPLFQSTRDGAAWLRDASFLPMGRVPIGRGNMLRVLTGTRRGWFGRYPLPEGFDQALVEAARRSR